MSIRRQSRTAKASTINESRRKRAACSSNTVYQTVYEPDISNACIWCMKANYSPIHSAFQYYTPHRVTSKSNFSPQYNLHI